jgi:hypothetical protein
MKKRRQHHVWQRYLKSWAVDDKIYCLKDGAIFATNTTNVAVERDFYKLQKLTPDDVALIENLIIAPAHPLAKQNHENLLRQFTLPARFVEENRDRLHNLDKIEELLDVHHTNALEDYHAGIEDSFLPTLEDLLRNDLSFYESNDRCIGFLYFICNQYMRTKGIRERSIERVKGRNEQDLSRIWNIAALMLAYNIGMGLFLERKSRKLILVENRTDVPFITGDQPIINLHGDGLRPPEELCLYYPLSPNVALLLTEVDSEPAFSTDSLTSAQATSLNERMLEACHSQLFGQTEASLLPYKSLQPASETS